MSRSISSLTEQLPVLICMWGGGGGGGSVKLPKPLKQFNVASERVEFKPATMLRAAQVERGRARSRSRGVRRCSATNPFKLAASVNRRSAGFWKRSRK